MKQTGNKWFVIGLVLLVMLLPAVTAAASGTTGAAPSPQIGQRLIVYLAEPACTSSEAATQQTSFNAAQPAADCWLVYQSQAVFNRSSN